MLTNKRYQQLLSLATSGKPLDKDATDEEKNSIKSVNVTIKLCLKPLKNME
mgnify:CR=1 FL=1